MAIIQIDNGHFGYDEAGVGPAVIFIHAGCADRRMWVHQFQLLKNHYRTICYDWRGYGESDDAHDRFSHHDDLIAIMNALNIEQAVLVGSSDGGKIALDAALQFPERVSALVLISSGLSGHEWPLTMLSLYQERVHQIIGFERLQKYRAAKISPIVISELERYSEAETEFLVAGPNRTRDTLDPQVWKIALEMDTKQNLRKWSSQQSAPQSLVPPAKGRLGEIKIPTLIVSGSKDLPEIISVSNFLADQIEGSLNVRIPGSAHLPALESYAVFNPIFLDFLTSI